MRDHSVLIIVCEVDEMRFRRGYLPAPCRIFSFHVMSYPDPFNRTYRHDLYHGDKVDELVIRLSSNGATNSRLFKTFMTLDDSPPEESGCGLRVQMSPVESYVSGYD